MAKKPPWLARNQAEREAMQDWAFAKLDAPIEKESDAMIRLLCDPNVQACIHEISRKQLRSEEHAIAQAIRGNMEPLLKRHPQYKNKPFLRPPKLKRFDKEYELQLLIKCALADARRIKEIWKAEYDGKCNRPQGQITAIEIAAERWGLSVDAKGRLRAAKK